MPYQNPTPKLSLGGEKQDNQGTFKHTASKQNSLQTTYTFKKDIYFAFIDALGFKQTFEDYSDRINHRIKAEEFAEKYAEVFGYFLHLIDISKILNAKNCYAGQTSDSLYFYTDRLDILAKFLKIYSYFVAFAMSRNIFFRGGVAKGNLFVNNQPYQFYGDCIIKAYLLEEKIAQNPVLCFDQETYKDFEKNCEYNIHLDEDSGRYFLSPFYAYDLAEISKLTGLSVDNIPNIDEKAIKNYIEKGKKRFEFDNNNYLKYHYLESQYIKSQEEQKETVCDKEK